MHLCSKKPYRLNFSMRAYLIAHCMHMHGHVCHQAKMQAIANVLIETNATTQGGHNGPHSRSFKITNFGTNMPVSINELTY